MIRRRAFAGLGRGGAVAICVLICGLVFFALVAQVRPVGAVYGVSLETLQPWGLTPLAAEAVPAEVAAAAQQVAREIYRGDGAVNEYAAGLRALYGATAGKEVLVVFSPGGWGTMSLEHSAGWTGIAQGLDALMRESGRDWLLLNCQRTPRRWYGKPDEVWAQARNYPHKAPDLAGRLDFITTQRPELTVFLASESNGTIFNDRVMLQLTSRARVYNIVTGPPFYYDVENRENTLLLDHNGEVPDSFSRGDLGTIVRSNYRAIFGRDGDGRPAGEVLGHLQAPGHYYGWERPRVAAQITAFVTGALAP